MAGLLLSPMDHCFRNIDQKLFTIQREVRFIARTVARLRHRHNAVLVFSNKSLPYHKATADLQSRLSTASLAMWRKLFSSKNSQIEAPLDVESAPATPCRERPPSWIDLSSPTAASDNADMYFDYVPISPPKFEDQREVIVDDRSPSTFSIPEAWIPSIPPSSQEDSSAVVVLAKLSTTEFFDYLQWRKTGRILQYAHNNVEYAIEQQGRTLISALSCGVSIENIDYQRAAMQEYLSLAPLLPWPEDYVNSVFAATSAAARETETPPHAARRMIVAIVAAKTCGSGKRKVRQGPREKGVARGDRIETGTFWSLYDAYCAERGLECGWPESVDEFMTQ